MVLKKLRNLCALGLAGVMFCGTMFSVTAISPKDLFDADYYAEQYPDVVAAVADFSPEAIVEKAEEIKKEADANESSSSSTRPECSVHGSAHVFVETGTLERNDVCTEWGAVYYECECGVEMHEAIYPFHMSIAATSAANDGIRCICNACGKWVDADGNVYDTQTDE